MGQTLSSTDVTNVTHEIATEGLQNGVYLVTVIYNNNIQATVKVVKK